MLVLSLFPGIDLLGRGFEEEGFCVVRGPDLLWGGDIRRFSPPPGRFEGVIGGSPCQDFSSARRAPASGYGMAMLAEFARVVEEAAPAWWLLENVPGVPDLNVNGYSHQRLDLRATECGLSQRRLRHFQFGHRSGFVLVLARGQRQRVTQRAALASEGRKHDRRAWANFCALQGLPRSYRLPAFTVAGAYRAVGNGVPVPMARLIARGIASLGPGATACVCGCGRPVTGRATMAGAACRKRMQRRRERVTNQNGDLLGTSQCRLVTGDTK